MNTNKIFYRFLLFFSVFLFTANIIYSQIVGAAYIEVIENYLPFNNSGIIADVNVPPNGRGGQFSVETFLFSSGLWLSGYTNDSVWANGVASATLIEDYRRYCRNKSK